MKILEKIISWVEREEEKLNGEEYWKNRYEELLKQYSSLKEEKLVYYENKIKRQDELLQSQKQRISELEDEIDIQKSKAAKYLSCYLTEMEKHAPND